MEHRVDFLRTISRPRRSRRRDRSYRSWPRWGELRFVLLCGVFIGLATSRVDIGTLHSIGLSDFAGSAAAPPASSQGLTSTHFSLCHTGGGIDCVVDGDTFWLSGQRIRIADIDTPETHPSRCEAEARVGKAATLRLQALLNAGPITLIPIDRDTDRYGRKLRIVERDGGSLGGVLVGEGLARWYAGGRRAEWCGTV